MENVSSILKAALLLVILTLFVGTAALAEEKQGEKKEVAEKKVRTSESEARVSEVNLPTAAELVKRQYNSGTTVMSPTFPMGIQQQQQEGGEEVVDNGTDPGSLGLKHLPYYRYTELDNGVIDSDAITLFTMVPLPLTPFTALVFEWPVMKYRDYSSLFTPTGELIGDPEGGAPGLPGGVPFIEGVAAPRVIRQNIQGFGDFRIRLIQGVGMVKSIKTVFLVGGDIVLPWASDYMLSAGAYQVSPLFAHVTNFNPLSFIAVLHFYFFDAGQGTWKDEPFAQDADIGFYLARIFFQKAWKSGYYFLPEAQVIYDTKVDEGGFSLWIGPEVGAVLGNSPAITGYIKPGFGISPDPGERKWSVEFGIRIIP